MNSGVDSDTVAEATSAFLEDHTEGKQALNAVLAVDSEMTTWTFEDIPIDSGTFGELVSRGIVQKVDGQYQLTDPESVQAVLDGNAVTTEESTETSSQTLPLPSINRRAAAGLAVALCVIAGARMTKFNAVFQRGYAISPGNDPYYFRYWLNELVASSSGLADYSVVARSEFTRPVSHTTNWFFAELLGGSPWAVETVSMWLPIVMSIALGMLVYKLAVLLTDDVRVGITSVLVLAVTPVHATYSGLGFLDHNTHQYFWLGVTLLTLCWLTVDLQTRLDNQVDSYRAMVSQLRSPRTWIVVVLFALSIAAGIHAWGGSPLLLVPLAGYIGLRVPMDVRANISPLLANLPLIIGLSIGSVLSLLLHSYFGWQSSFASATPLLVFLGSVSVTLLGALWNRRERDSRMLIASEGLIALLILFIFRQLRPQDWEQILTEINVLFSNEGASETVSLFSTEYAVLFGPLYQFGIPFYISLAVFGWIGFITFRRYEPGWLILGTYSGFLLVFATIQSRFAGQLAIPFSVLGGLGVLYLFSVIEIARQPNPFKNDNGSENITSFSLSNLKNKSLIGFAILIFGISLILVPAFAGQTSYSSSQANALDAIDTHATTFDREYPNNRVFSPWGESRMYNYFVSGESQSYGFAYRRYEGFISNSNPDDRYDTYGDDIGYVVVNANETAVPAESTHYQLFTNLGAGGDNQEALSHYQLLAADRSVAAFAVVPGATIIGTGQSGETINVTTPVSIDDTSFSYNQTVTVGDDGQFAVTLPYAGVYRVGSERVTVSETDVIEGAQIEPENIGSSE